jgi:uncharacterized protein (DUF4415 family)
MSRADDDNPEWTKETFRKARRALDIFPQLDLPKPRKGRGPQKTPTKVQTTIRLDSDVIAHFKARGRGWQTLVNDTLREAVERRPPSRRKTRAR